MTTLESSQLPFADHLRRSYGELRSSLAELLHAVNAPTDRPQHVARQLKINRNLAWKMCRLIETHDPAAGCEHIPGNAGLDLVLTACAEAGAQQATVNAVAKARDEFDRMQQIHAGDRHMFDLMLDSVANGWHTERLEKSRRLAFQGASGIWGIQTRVRVTTHVVAPSRSDSTMLDLGMTGGYVDCVRIRPNVRWPLFQLQTSHDDGTVLQTLSDANESVFDQSTNQLVLLDEFCSDNMPEIVSRRKGEDVFAELGESPVGKTGAFSCFFIDIARRCAPRYRTERDREGRCGASVYVPSEMMLFDMLMHRDVVDIKAIEAHLYGMLPGAPPISAPRSAEDILPIPDEPIYLSEGLPELTTSLVPRYREMIERMFTLGGWDRREFRGVRFIVKYPPMPSVSVMQFALPEKPEE